LTNLKELEFDKFCLLEDEFNKKHGHGGISSEKKLHNH